jgi:hypothetical protein
MLEGSQNILLADGVVHVHGRGEELRVLDLIGVLQAESLHDLAQLVLQEIETLWKSVRREDKEAMEVT